MQAGHCMRLAVRGLPQPVAQLRASLGLAVKWQVPAACLAPSLQTQTQASSSAPAGQALAKEWQSQASKKRAQNMCARCLDVLAGRMRGASSAGDLGARGWHYNVL